MGIDIGKITLYEGTVRSKIHSQVESYKVSSKFKFKLYTLDSILCSDCCFRFCNLHQKEEQQGEIIHKIQIENPSVWMYVNSEVYPVTSQAGREEKLEDNFMYLAIFVIVQILYVAFCCGFAGFLSLSDWLSEDQKL